MQSGSRSIALFGLLIVVFAISMVGCMALSGGVTIHHPPHCTAHCTH